MKNYVAELSQAWKNNYPSCATYSEYNCYLIEYVCDVSDGHGISAPKGMRFWWRSKTITESNSNRYKLVYDGRLDISYDVPTCKRKA